MIGGAAIDRGGATRTHARTLARARAHTTTNTRRFCHTRQRRAAPGLFGPGPASSRRHRCVCVWFVWEGGGELSAVIDADGLPVGAGLLRRAGRGGHAVPPGQLLPPRRHRPRGMLSPRAYTPTHARARTYTHRPAPLARSRAPFVRERALGLRGRTALRAWGRGRENTSGSCWLTTLLTR